MKRTIVEPNSKELGTPDIEFGGLQIWAHDRKYPESKYVSDTGWLNATFLCKDDGSSVWLSGDILHNTDVAEWVLSLENLGKGLSESVTLPTLERYVSLAIGTETYERISIKVDLTPDRVFQRHYFEFWMKKDSLVKMVNDCRELSTKFPILERQI